MWTVFFFFLPWRCILLVHFCIDEVRQSSLYLRCFVTVCITALLLLSVFVFFCLFFVVTVLIALVLHLHRRDQSTLVFVAAERPVGKTGPDRRGSWILDGAAAQGEKKGINASSLALYGLPQCTQVSIRHKDGSVFSERRKDLVACR